MGRLAGIDLTERYIKDKNKKYIHDKSFGYIFYFFDFQKQETLVVRANELRGS